MAKSRLIDVVGLRSGYEKKQVLDGIDLHVAPGEIVAIIGHNGAGKSTLLKTVFGLLPLWSGHIEIDGARIASPSPRRMLQVGVTYVPQGNRVFPDLTVRENLEIASVALNRGVQASDVIDSVFLLFPALKPHLGRRAGTLSGGEKQMLALGGALTLSPRLLLLDEPSLGLSPYLVTEALQRIQQVSRQTGSAVLIVEQKVRETLKIASRVYVFRTGEVTYSGSTESLTDNDRLRDVFL